MLRRCPACRKPLLRRDGEKRAYFLARNYCDHACAVADRGRKAELRREELDAADTRVDEELAHLGFDRAQIMHAAREAAPPSVPMPVLSAIVDAVEPLIADTVRRRLMAVIGARVRDQRPA